MDRKGRGKAGSIALAMNVIATSATLTGTAWSQSSSPKTIPQILASPVRDEVVSVPARIVSLVEGNTYLLSDEKGEATILAGGGPPWYHKIVLPIGQVVTVIGEVSVGPPQGKGKGQGLQKQPQNRPPAIDLYKVVLPNNGGEIIVRGPGKPPWAGGPKKH